MLREILFSVLTVTWSASSEAQPIPNPAHSCLESICGPMEVVQPYFYQVKKDQGLESAADEYPCDVQAIVSDIINLGDEQRDLENSASEKTSRDEKKLSALKREHTDEFEQLKMTLGKCQDSYIWYQRTLPAADQIEHLRSEVIDTAKAMKPDMEHLLGYMPDVNAIYIDLPPSKSKFAELFKDHLRQLRLSIQDHIDRLKKSNFGSGAIANSAESEELRIDPRAFSCDIFSLDLAGDEYYSSAFTGEVIRLSPMTARGNPESREATIRHELAHSAIRQVERYDPQIVEMFEDCLSQQHPEPQSKDQLEEDFADLLAMATWKKKQNPFCQVLLEVDATRHDYSDNAMYSEEDLSHSSHLFRILHLEFMKQGSLSQACKDYLNEIKYPIGFRNCLSSFGIF
jgi:hypothetical protein